MEEKKIGKGKTILIVILIIVIGALIGYILCDKGILGTKTEKVEVKEKKQVKEEEKELDLTKSLNTTDIEYSDPVLLTNTYENIGLSINVNDDKKTATLSIDWDIFGPHSTASTWGSGIAKEDVKGFTKNIKKAYIDGIGQDSMGTMLIFLMEDQTLEYISLFESKFDSQGTLYYEMSYTYDRDAEGKVISEYFKSKGQIPEVENITELYGAQVLEQTGGYHTILAKTKDGSFYDLSESIK